MRNRNGYDDKAAEGRLIKQQFQRFDFEGSGLMSNSEMRVMFRSLGLDLQENEFDLLLGADIEQKDESINFESFVDWLLSSSDPFDSLIKTIDEPPEVSYKSAAPKPSAIGTKPGKQSEALIPKPFNGYYTLNCIPSVTPAAMMQLYSKFPNAVDKLVPKQSSKIYAPQGKPSGALISKPFNAYYTANCMPNVEPAAMMVLYEKFPKAADKLTPKVSKEPTSSTSNQSAFRNLPSVGSWLAKPVQLKRIKPFNKLPSVGTWLSAPAPEAGQAAASS